MPSPEYCLARSNPTAGNLHVQIESPSKAKEKENTVGSRQYNELPSSRIVFHHPMSISNLIQFESLRDGNPQRACLNLVHQLLQRGLHEFFWTARVSCEAHRCGNTVHWSKLVEAPACWAVSRSPGDDLCFANNLLSPTMPVIQTIPCGFTHCSESSSVVVPMSSRTLFTPPPVSSLTLAAMLPSSTITMLAPRSFNSCVLLSLRLVETTVTP
jgi:hypothetical protein